MPLFSTLRTLSNYVRLLRYGDSLHSSPKYRIGTKTFSLKTIAKPSRQSFGALECTLNVNNERNRIHGRVVRVHVNKMGNMASEHNEIGMHTTHKENDDISLPFWIFLWSVLAVVAGYIYSKLNKPSEIKFEAKSGENDTTNDEQIARKLVNEIAKKHSERKPTFRRQRSYEIIDGEVRIHYDVSMLEDSLHKRANIEGILKSAEVNSIPIQSTSLEDLEFINAGKLPRIVEEGDEKLLEGSEKQTTLPALCMIEGSSNEEKYKETQKTAEKFDKILTLKKDGDNLQAERLYTEENQGEFPTNYVTVTEEAIIPTASTNDAKKLANDPLKINCNELSYQSETNFKEIKNEVGVKESSSFVSGYGDIENISGISSTGSKNTLNSSNTSVYKLSEVERTREHKYVVTRREITKLKSNKEKILQSDFFGNETSFPFHQKKENEATTGIGVNSSQLSSDLTNVNLTAQQGVRIERTDLASEHIEEVEPLLLEKGAKNGRPDGNAVAEINNLKLKDPEGSALENQIFQAGKKKLVGELPSRSYNELKELPTKDGSKLMDRSSQQPSVLESFNEGSDNSEVWLRGKKIVENNGRQKTLDENENCDWLSCEKELGKTWKSLPSWQGVSNEKHFDSECFHVNHVDQERSMQGAESLILKNIELKQQNTELTNTQSSMQCTSESVFNEEIKEAELLTFENKIGTRKTIFVKDTVENIHGRNEKSLGETSFDISSDPTIAARVEDVTVLKGENMKPDILEYNIPGES